MNLIADSSEQAALREEYRLALHDWSRARATHAANLNAREVIEATHRLEEIERQLRSHHTQLVKYQGPVPGR